MRKREEKKRNSKKFRKMIEKITLKLHGVKNI